MQVSLGFKHAARQIEIETSASHDEILGALADSATKDVVLTDDKGRKVLVPAGSLAYAELGAAEQRRVGFGI
ncbi:Protein of unknown function [Actinomyces denticolens]|uniref:ATP-binding protein n=1 Tax=Actinomyces denticolens TaxID=52767 RepID=A0ABY1I111_9ACTO|nr:DUF3107 domain-containing protein [Actinomyces denticolens]SHI40969.1 Protein of unknown function [Actinomyces denticolens]